MEETGIDLKAFVSPEFSGSVHFCCSFVPFFDHSQVCLNTVGIKDILSLLVWNFQSRINHVMQALCMFETKSF